MGKLFVFAIALCGFGIFMSDTRAEETPVAAAGVASPKASDAPAPSPIAHRPGEPMLVPGQPTDLQRAGDGHFYADVTVNGQPVGMMVDTGASTVALTVDDARRLGVSVDPASFQVVGTGASGPVRGAPVALNEVALGGRHVGAVQAVVVEGLDRSLLGQSFLGKLDQVQITGDTMTLR